ncbi:TLC domain-containing protein 4-B [Xenoophorus captivus]|uniref:TLC domain-containing protein 4-B n=1 Tax=Xenoophorus captivus TaxID=1517983 RepID=A0ABV0SBZ8_9TELE
MHGLHWLLIQVTQCVVSCCHKNVFHFSWFFEVLGYPKSSRPNMANGVAMAVVFFMVRIAVMPVYYSRMFAVYGTEAFYLVPWGGRVAWICSSICLDIMNIMWMHKIARGCYKVLRSARHRKAPAPQENGKTD